MGKRIWSDVKFVFVISPKKEMFGNSPLMSDNNQFWNGYNKKIYVTIASGSFRFVFGQATFLCQLNCGEHCGNWRSNI